MKSLSGFTIAALIGTAPMAQASFKDLLCDDSVRLERQLSNLHGAEKQGRGIRGPDALIEMWVDPRSGDWTLVQNYSNGTSCIVAMGQHWEELQVSGDLPPRG